MQRNSNVTERLYTKGGISQISFLFSAKAQKNDYGNNQHDGDRTADEDCTIDTTSSFLVTAKPEEVKAFFKMSLTCFYEVD